MKKLSEKIKESRLSEFTEKIQEKEKIIKIAKFASVLALAAILMSFISSLNLEMRFPRRQVAMHTNAVLQASSVDTQFYEHSIIIPEDSPVLEDASEKLTRIGMEERDIEGSRQFLATSLHPEDENIVDEYTKNLRAQGHIVYTSPALIDIQGTDEPFQVDIIPECVGWIGMFAIVSLIIAYPDANKKDKFLGIVLSIPLVHLMNIVRLSTTIYAGWARGIQFLDLVHDFLWRTLLIIWALLLWIIWIKYIAGEDEEE